MWFWAQIVSTVHLLWTPQDVRWDVNLPLVSSVWYSASSLAAAVRDLE